MPRQQPPPDPSQGATAAFAQLLYALRQAVGNPSYREMGERANISHTSLSRASKGDRFPTWETTKAFVIACDTDVQLWQGRWEAAKAEIEEEKRVQNAPTVPLTPISPPSPIYDPDPSRSATVPSGGPARGTIARRGVPDPLAGELPALTRQLAAEIQAGSAAPADPRSAVTPVAEWQEQSTVRLVPVGSGQQCRVVGTSGRPAGAHRKTTAHRGTRPVHRPPGPDTRFLGEDPPLWERATSTSLIAVLVLVWVLVTVLHRIIG